MDNLIDLEQLNYRDQMIKEYIDEKTASGGGGGSSDYIPVRLALTRQYPDISPSGTDEQHLYIGFPEGTDITDISLRFVRSNTVKQRNKREGFSGHKNKWRGLHDIWAIPVKDKIPLFNMTFDSETAFTKSGYVYYELKFIWNGSSMDTLTFINSNLETGYTALIDGSIEPIYVQDMLRHKRNGFILIKNNKIISGHIRFHTVYDNETTNMWRIDLY